MHIAIEMAPASGVPTLRSARGRALPTRGRRSAVPAAALPAMSTDSSHALRQSIPHPRRTRPLPRTVRAHRASSCRPGAHRRVRRGHRVRRATRSPHPCRSACRDRRACGRPRTAPRPTTRPTYRRLSPPRLLRLSPIPNRSRRHGGPRSRRQRWPPPSRGPCRGRGRRRRLPRRSGRVRFPPQTFARRSPSARVRRADHLRGTIRRPP